MASSVSSRSRCHMTGCRPKITRDQTPSSNSCQSSTPELEDSGVHLDDGPVFSCRFISRREDPLGSTSKSIESGTSRTSGVDVRLAAEIPTDVLNKTVVKMTIHSNSDGDSRTEEERNSLCPPPTSSPLSPTLTNCGRDFPQKSTVDACCIAAGGRRSPLLSVPPQTAPIARGTSDPGAVTFLSGGGGGGGRGGTSDQDSDGDSAPGGRSFLSAPETSMPPQRPCRETRNKMRFKRFLKPLRRSQSTGNNKQVSSPFSFFGRKDDENCDDCQAVDRPTGKGSLDPGSDGETGERRKEKDKKKKSITTEVKEKLYVLRRRYTDQTLSGKDGKLEKSNPEAIRNWAKTFDFLLADKYGLRLFHAFLKSEFSEENIDFWIACEEYKTLKPGKMAAQAQKIFAEFVAHQAPREINIDSLTRELTCAKMTQPDASTFDAAQKRIQALMDKDSYPRFLQSSLYLDLAIAGGQKNNPAPPSS